MSGFSWRAWQSHVRHRPIFLMTALMHLLWVSLMLGTSGSKLPTPVYGLVDTFGSTTTALTMITVMSGLAILGGGATRSDLAAWCLSGQQFLMLVSFGAGVYTVIAGQYPDGYPAPSWYILLDQSPAFTLEIVHTCVLYRYFSHKEWGIGLPRKREAI